MLLHYLRLSLTGHILGEASLITWSKIIKSHPPPNFFKLNSSFFNLFFLFTIHNYIAYYIFYLFIVFLPIRM